jgi:thiol-disulfide isomerase/thioredoxin
LKKRIYLLGFVFVALGIAWLWRNSTSTGEAISSYAILKHSLAKGTPVVVFFYSHDCPQCDLMKEPIQEARKEFSDSITFIDVDVNDIRNLAIVRKSGVFAVPTLAFYSKDGEKRLFLGVMDSAKLHERLLTLGSSG